MYNKSTRAQDTKASDIVTEFIYENLYRYIYKEPYIVSDKVAQCAGVDITVNNRTYIILIIFFKCYNCIYTIYTIFKNKKIIHKM